MFFIIIAKPRISSVAKSKEKQNYLKNQRSKEEHLQRETKRQKQSSSPKATNSSPKTDAMMISQIRESLHFTLGNPTEISGVSSCDVSAILSAGEMDDINKSLEGDLTDFVQIFTHVEAVESQAVAAESTVASPKGSLAETTSTSCLGR